jgi:hypothetical protein
LFSVNNRHRVLRGRVTVGSIDLLESSWKFPAASFSGRREWRKVVFLYIIFACLATELLMFLRNVLTLLNAQINSHPSDTSGPFYYRVIDLHRPMRYGVFRMYVVAHGSRKPLVEVVPDHLRAVVRPSA